MTESEYKELKEFAHLPVHDEDHPFCGSIERPTEGGMAVHEAPTLKIAREKLGDKNLTPKGGIRYWDGERKNSSVFAYFWEKKNA